METRPPIDLSDDRYLWDRQPRESDLMYGRFKQFRDLGRRRSLTALAKLLTEIGDRLTYGTIKYNAHIYRWTERAQAWDADQDDLDREQVTQARRDMIKRHIRIASALTVKALTAFKAIPAEELDPADVVRLIKLASDLELRALGEPHQIISVTGPGGGPIQTEELSQLDTTARRQRLKDVLNELARRLQQTNDTADDDEEEEPE
jgi:hypothetical protein